MACVYVYIYIYIYYSSKPQKIEESHLTEIEVVSYVSSFCISVGIMGIAYIYYWRFLKMGEPQVIHA